MHARPGHHGTMFSATSPPGPTGALGRRLAQRARGRLRLVFLGVLAAAAVAIAVLALSPAPEGTAVWITSETVADGEELRAGQPQVVLVSPATVPDQALPAGSDPGQLVSRRTVPARSILTELDTVGSARTRELAGSQALLPLAVPTELTAGFAAGEVVDLWGTGASCAEATCPPEKLAGAVLIDSIREPEGGGLSQTNLGQAGTTAISLVVPASAVGEILAAGAAGDLYFALTSALPAR